MLRTLRLQFADRPTYDLAFEPTSEESDPWKLLRDRADSDGRISLGDRESFRIEDVVDVTLVEPEPIAGPTWERGLQDEDTATALEENYDPPSRHVGQRLPADE
jgi:hypothetical protein